MFREEVQAGDINLAVITAQMAFNFTRPDENTKAVRKEKGGKDKGKKPWGCSKVKRLGR